MNWILIVVLAVLIFGAWMGYRKGILRIAVSLVSMVVSLVACMFVTPVLCSAVKANTEIHSRMTESVYNMIIGSDMYNDAFDKAVANSVSGAVSGLSDSVASDVASGLGAGRLEQYGEQVAEYVSAIAEEMNLPEAVMEGYGTSIFSSAVGDVLADETVTLRTMLAAVFAARVADMAINAIVYICVFAVVYIILKIVLMATGIIAKLPLIRQANRLVGLAFGFVEALVVVWLIFAVITACSNFAWAQDALVMIGNNSILTFIYENNFIMKTILG
jgi:uncharacterized membrane protein required for colicin V production